ncbi:MAG: hypothetical protein CVV39_06540 [Planctomycetes bacterium HGW-Planctomycetes-1]|nr:MAG: hypothetical protein CVV39_06540 [Planctomycetes bacterium HGW-Planctomycetes-1]
MKIEDLKIAFVLFISSLFKRKRGANDFKKMEFSISTQKMGVRFTDKIRDIFRHRWIKKS